MEAANWPVAFVTLAIHVQLALSKQLQAPGPVPQRNEGASTGRQTRKRPA